MLNQHHGEQRERVREGKLNHEEWREVKLGEVKILSECKGMMKKLDKSMTRGNKYLYKILAKESGLGAVTRGASEDEAKRAGTMLFPELNTLHQLPEVNYDVHDLVGLIKTQWINQNNGSVMETRYGTGSLFRFLKKRDGKYYISCLTAAHNIVDNEYYRSMPNPTVTFELRRSGKESELICQGVVETGAN